MAVLSTPVADAFVHFDPKVALVVALIAVVVYFFKQHNDFEKRRGGAKTLPGPKGAPIIGNLRQIPAVKPWVALKQWGDEYGEFPTSTSSLSCGEPVTYPGFSVPVKSGSSPTSAKQAHYTASDSVYRKL